MRCFLQQDYPKRVKADNGVVVHAAQPVRRHYRGKIDTACGLRYIVRQNGLSYSNADELDNTTTITCKNCQRALGMTAQENESNGSKLFVLVEKATGQYYNSNGSRHKQWVDNLKDATLFKTMKGVMESGNRDVYYEPGGDEIDHTTYMRAMDDWYSRCQYKREIARQHRRCRRFDDERFEIKSVEVFLV